MKVKTMVQCALFSALLCICAWLSIPAGNVVFTMQTFGVFLSLLLLGGKRGTLTVLVYLLLGAVGLPVFSGFRGGVGVLLGPTGGYLWGFALMAVSYWLVCASSKNWALAAVVGLIVCYITGICQAAFYFGQDAIVAVVLQSVVPYVIPDGLKLILALLCARKLKRFVY